MPKQRGSWLRAAGTGAGLITNYFRGAKRARWYGRQNRGRRVGYGTGYRRRTYGGRFAKRGRRFRRRFGRSRLSRRSKFIRGRKKGNVSALIRFKRVAQMDGQFLYSGAQPDAVPVEYNGDAGVDYFPVWGDNISAEEQIDRFEYFTLERVTTKIRRVRINRIVQTVLQPQSPSENAIITEDKLDIEDPVIYYWRNKTRGDWPTDGSYRDVATFKVIRNPKDGFMWTTKFSKNHRKMIPRATLRLYFGQHPANTPPTRQDLFRVFGIDGDYQDYNGVIGHNDLHCSEFIIGRGKPFDDTYYDYNGIPNIVASRYVRDGIMFEMVNYMTFRGWRKNYKRD